ncbi:hypothetical protein EX30DRAFT_342860 [Ascodesmis nigricans]|uniref:Uncharacterized protein n=1 Tax=Ascodesmis nigricans TaxID=341454 RepID=A0A4S2MSF9_9PEZI|nr:hypothetical protein EX30DRAFT_342860 [Ascodesmis nigricans]
MMSNFEISSRINYPPRPSHQPPSSHPTSDTPYPQPSSPHFPLQGIYSIYYTSAECRTPAS